VAFSEDDHVDFLRLRRCESGNVNDHYYNRPFEAITDDGVEWYIWHGWSYAIKSVVMMLRASDLKHLPSIIAQWPAHLTPPEDNNHPPYGQ